MFIDTWIVITAPPVIGALGFLIGVRFMAEKVADANSDIAEAEANRDYWLAQYDRIRSGNETYVSAASYQSRLRLDAEDAHARCADSRNTLLARIDRLKSIAASQQSVKSGRIVAVLEGDR